MKMTVENITAATTITRSYVSCNYLYRLTEDQKKIEIGAKKRFMTELKILVQHIQEKERFNPMKSYFFQRVFFILFVFGI